MFVKILLDWFHQQVVHKGVVLALTPPKGRQAGLTMPELAEAEEASV
jgi:hypothetical protein